MSTRDSHKETLRRIADEMMASRKHPKKRPLSRVLEYLEGLEHCTERLTRVLSKVEALAFRAALLSIFIWEVIKLFKRLGP
jgi:hypothetical protein